MIRLLICLVIKILDPIVTELLIRGKKLNISLAFIAQYYIAVPKNIKLNATHYFTIKISNKQEFQQIAFNHSSDIGYRDFLNLYKNVLKMYILFFSDWYNSWIR